MSITEFSKNRIPQKRNGLTSIEAVSFLKSILPNVKDWCSWLPAAHEMVSKIVSSQCKQQGEAGIWNWEKITCNYPEIYYHQNTPPYPLNETIDDWTGLIRVYNDRKSFYLFSYLSSTGTVGCRYLVSETDCQFLDQFENELLAFFNTDNGTRVNTTLRQDIIIDDGVLEIPVFLENGLKSEIEEQVFSFFTEKELFAQLRITYKRGLLFVGKPGLGKTLMAKRLAYQCHKKFKAKLWTLIPTRRTDDDDLESLFAAARKSGPSLIILEELDSLVTDTDISRATFLGLLDGLTTNEGIFIIGTTNNPEKIDPSLMHRPSRFDRVWHFNLPSSLLRRQFLEYHFKTLKKDTIDQIVTLTEGWSFAYINELRVTSGIIAATRKLDSYDGKIVLEALSILAEQFQGGKKNHVDQEKKINGFGIV